MFFSISAAIAVGIIKIEKESNLIGYAVKIALTISLRGMIPVKSIRVDATLKTNCPIALAPRLLSQNDFPLSKIFHFDINAVFKKDPKMVPTKLPRKTRGKLPIIFEYELLNCQ